MFQALLKDVVESTEGGLASAVMDLDGITLESYTRPGETVDIKTIGIELTLVLRSAQQAATMLELGAAEELSFATGALTLVVRMVTASYFVAIALDSGGNLGRARYLLRARMPELVGELS
jgi:predicted regulator of Ras-like GTPase activity (Roadblock/LC7/MglB family)